MPLVEVTRNPKFLDDEQARDFGPRLQRIVALRLTCGDPGGVLDEKEIEVRFRDPGPLDVNVSDLQVEIFANHFPSREANIDERTAQIAKDLHNHTNLPHVLFRKGNENFVWVFLGRASFKKL